MVPNGFQHISGLGNFPSDWQVMSADCVTTKITKGTTPPKSEIVQDSNIPFLRVNNLSFNGRLNSSSEMLFVSSAAHEGFLARSIAYPDDILMNIVGPPLGKISMLDKQYDSYNMNQAIVIYRTSPEHIDKYYFLKFLTSELAQQWLQSRSKKTSGQQNLTIQLCKELPVPVPPRLEQRKIAKILSTWDKAISTTERLIDNSKQQKKALMQQLLTGKKRLLDDSGKPFEGEWEELSLHDIFPVIDSLHKTPKFSETGYPMVRVTDIKGGKLSLESTLRVNEAVFQEYTKKYKPKSGDIVFSRVGSYGNSSIVKTTKPFCLGQNTVIASSKKDHSSEYIYQFLNTTFIKRQIEKNVDGSSHKTVSLKIIRNLKLLIPCKSEQKKIADVLTNADKEIELLEQQLADLKKEKKALMQQLLTGKRRVKI